MNMGTVGGLGGMQRGIGFWFCRCYRTAKPAKTEFSAGVPLEVWFCQCYRIGLKVRHDLEEILVSMSTKIVLLRGDRMGPQYVWKSDFGRHRTLRL